MIKQVTIQEFEAVEKEIRANHKKPEDTFVTWKKLHEDFKVGSVQIDKQYRWTYFRLYTELTWQLISELERDEFVAIAIARQIPMAMLLDFDVWKKIMWYLVTRARDDKEMISFYSQIREAFYNSEAFVGSWKGKDVNMKELVNDVRSIKRQDASSLEVAEIMAKIKEAFFPKNNTEVELFVSADQKQLVEQFVGLYDFFAEHEPEKIWFTSQAFLHPELYDELGEFINDNEKKLSELENGNLPTAATEVESTSNKKPPYLEIRMIAERKFEKDASGDFKEPGDVMGMLDEWATKYNDDKIRELFIFNEQTGSFEWNNQLLAQ